jgi:hypothetical protein
MGEKRKSTSPTAIQVKNRQKTIGIEEKSDIISWLEKGEWIVDVCCNVKLTHSSTRTICDNAYRTEGSAWSETKVFVYQDYHSPIGINRNKNYGCEGFSDVLIALEIKKDIV